MSIRTLPRFDPSANYVIARASAQFPNLPAGAPVPPEILASQVKLRGLYRLRRVRPLEPEPESKLKNKVVKRG